MTPMMRQYRQIKKKHKDAILFFRLGDFYEMFYEDAKVASRILGLVLTQRGGAPMAGIPYHAASTYLRKLIKAGYRIAICEQVEDPKLAKGIVKRMVTRIITPGTVTDEGVLEERENNFLVALLPPKTSEMGGEESGPYGLAWTDLTTGDFAARDLGAEEVLDELTRLAPAECLVPERALKEERERLLSLGREISCPFTAVADWAFERRSAHELLKEHFQVASLDGFGCEELGPGVGSAGAIIHYLKETQKTTLSHINRIRPYDAASYLVLDRSGQKSLELCRTLHTGEREGSLLSILDRTITPMGARVLKRWLLLPLRDVAAIQERASAVEEFVKESALRKKIRAALERVYDIERITSRISSRRVNPRHLLSLAQSLVQLPLVKTSLAQCTSKLLLSFAKDPEVLEDIRSQLQRAIHPAAPTSLTEGGIIRQGYNQELDRLRGLKDESQKWLARFQAQEIKRTGITSLKIGFNKVFGYYIGVTNMHKDKVPPDYVRKQTLKNAERYITAELKSHESEVLSADERIKELEYEIFVEVRDSVAKSIQRLQKVARIIAQIDLLAALAQVAQENGYTKPLVDDSLKLEITDGRHPVLEKTLVDERFVPNDINLDGEGTHMAVVTGPNMAGKSTYIRQVALIVLMAQMGSFVPAKRARIGVVDRIFTRLGAADELYRGKSTFLVEMNEAANILNNATSRSLVILDEVGRGTSTFDGLSIAWAVSEYLARHIRPRTLFATHYHELTELALVLPGVKNFNVAVREWGDEVIFLYKVVEGATDKSYGIQVARLAGIPKKVIERAKVILNNLETEAVNSSGLPKFAPPASVAAATQGRDRSAPLGEPSGKPVQMDLFARQSPLLEEIRAIDLDKMTPLEALLKLRELKKKSEGKK